MGSYRDILGQNHKILLKNRQILEKMYNHLIFTSISNPWEFFLINVTGSHFWCSKHSLSVLLVILGQKPQILGENLLNCYHWIAVIWITNNPSLPPKGYFKVTIFWKLMNNATKWSMFALWPMGRSGDILGQIHKILLKNRQILEKMYNHFIFISI
jgi:hypothetical protein